MIVHLLKWLGLVSCGMDILYFLQTGRESTSRAGSRPDGDSRNPESDNPVFARAGLRDKEGIDRRKINGGRNYKKT